MHLAAFPKTEEAASAPWKDFQRRFHGILATGGRSFNFLQNFSDLLGGRDHTLVAAAILDDLFNHGRKIVVGSLVRSVLMVSMRDPRPMTPRGGLHIPPLRILFDRVPIGGD